MGRDGAGGLPKETSLEVLQIHFRAKFYLGTAFDAVDPNEKRFCGSLQLTRMCNSSKELVYGITTNGFEGEFQANEMWPSGSLFSPHRIFHAGVSTSFQLWLWTLHLEGPHKTWDPIWLNG